MPSDDPQPALLLDDGRPVATAYDAARFLGVPLGRLSSALYTASDDKRYRAFEIPKRTGGMRQIHAPIGLVRELQTKLAPILLERYRAHPAAHGFLKERGILTNAKLHVGQRLVLNIDLEDFFPTVNFGRVRGLFMAPPFQLGPAAASVFAQLCTHKNGLPQGAPTSPMLSNFAAADLDRRLSRLARENGVRYSRYADDITFSTNQITFPPSIAVFGQAEAGGGLSARAGEALERAVIASGFAINAKKVRLQKRDQRQSVTGLSVNAKANVTRKRVRRLRAMLHAWEKFGIERAAGEHFIRYRGLLRMPKNPARAFRDVVYGQLSFMKMVRGADDEIFLKFCAKLLKLDPNPSRFVRAMVFGADNFDVFISHASEDKEVVARPIYEACTSLGLKVFLDEAHIGWGQSFTEKINSALGSARTVLAIISPNAVAKEWPIVEVNTALSLEVSGQKKVVPLIVGKPDLSKLPLIHGKDSMLWSGDAEIVARRLQAAVNGAAPRRPAKPAPTAVAKGPWAKTRARGAETPGGGLPSTRSALWEPNPEPRKRGFWARLFGGRR